MADEQITSLGLRTLVTSGGDLTITIEEEAVGPLAPDEVVVKVEASAINPTDLGLLLGLLGPTELIGMAAFTKNGRPALRASIPPERLGPLQTRLDKSLPVGTEGAGTVVAAGSNVADLIGRTVSVSSGGMYATYRKVKADACIVLPAGTTAQAGAAVYVNPMTALSMVETMRMEGHTALIQTAAASSVGQMLNRICLSDGIPLINVVRSDEHVELLRSAGADHVLNSSANSFFDDLTKAIAETGATLAFDAIGGGMMADTILNAMETSWSADQSAFSRYGSSDLKQLYIYGSLNLEPTILTRTYGSSWAVGRWLFLNILRRIDADALAAMKRRIVDEMSTTFATEFAETISLEDAVDPAIIGEYAKRATGRKYLVDPSR